MKKPIPFILTLAAVAILSDCSVAQAATVGGTSWTLAGTIVPRARLVARLKAPAYGSTISTALPVNPLAASTPAIRGLVQFNSDGTFNYSEIDALAAAAADLPYTVDNAPTTSGTGATATTTYSRKSNKNQTEPYATATSSPWKPAGVSKWVSTAFSPTAATATTTAWTQSYTVSATPASNTSSTTATNPPWTFNLWTPYSGNWTQNGNKIALTLDAASTARLYAVYNGNTSTVAGTSTYASPAFNQQSYSFTGLLNTGKTGATSLTLNQSAFLNINKAFETLPGAAPKGTWSYKYRYVKVLKSQ